MAAILLLISALVVTGAYWQRGKKATDKLILIIENPEVKAPASPATSSDKQTEGLPPAIEAAASPAVIIEETGVGWLRVRQGPGVNFEEITRVTVGQSYLLLEETEYWYKIEVDENIQGWIFNKYATKKAND